MTNQEQWLTAIIIALGVLLTRFLVFWIFPAHKEPPQWIAYLGSVLPPAAISLIVLYALKDTRLLTYPYGIPQIISVLAVVFCQAWKRNTLISIFVGTLLYMFLVQQVFI
ncbi:branched-chain amino acid transporter permease [Hutsoniella sourekii]|uniref:branched-chain amino acid transporter permease n=1 Tax=Hutsoniella sourekii TaxID=87650 RepID=UPI00047FC431|nr:AzlD domain-containing protein [Hutsoniella sourekii]